MAGPSSHKPACSECFAKNSAARLAGRMQIAGAAMIKAIVPRKLVAMIKRIRSGPVDDNVTQAMVRSPKNLLLRLLSDWVVASCEESAIGERKIDRWLRRERRQATHLISGCSLGAQNCSLVLNFIFIAFQGVS